MRDVCVLYAECMRTICVVYARYKIVKGEMRENEFSGVFVDHKCSAHVWRLVDAGGGVIREEVSLFGAAG